MYYYLILAISSIALLFPNTLMAQQKKSGISDPCNLAEVKKEKIKACITVEIGYYTEPRENQLPKKGQLVIKTLDVYSDDIRPYYGYHFYSDKGDLVNLNKFDPRAGTWAKDLIIKSLGINPAKAGGTARYRLDMFTDIEDRFFLYEEGKFKVVYTAKKADIGYPFKGEIKVVNRSKFEGDFDYKENAFSWKEANTTCQQKYSNEVDKKYQHPAFANRLIKDDSGYFYLCKFVKRKAESPNSLEDYLYRLDINKVDNPGPVLVNSSDYAKY